MELAHEFVRGKGQSGLKFLVGLFLNLLGMLKFLDELGLKFFHLQHLLLFPLSDVLLFLDPVLVHGPEVLHLLLMVFLNSEITQNPLSTDLFVSLSVRLDLLFLKFIFLLQDSLFLILDFSDLFVLVAVDGLEDVATIL